MPQECGHGTPLVDAPGMDARTPLHCAGTVAVPALLLDKCARIDARDEDHDSMPAQRRWAISRLQRSWSGRTGAARRTASERRWSFRSIYQWTLRFNSYPHQIALMKGHPAMFDFL